MATVDGQSHRTRPAPAVIRVVVKLARESVRAESAANPLSVALAELKRVAPRAEFKPYFAEETRLKAASVEPFNRYVVAETADRASADELARALQALDTVDVAYVEGGPVSPPVNPADDPRFGNQGYLTAAPAGIDAVWAWSRSSGAGVRFVDLERGWTLNHEDLAGANITLISGLNQDFQSHGTAVLGEVLAVDNTTGGVGIAPEATGRVVSQWRTSTVYNTAAAILSAGGAMNAGDVLLLEAQTSTDGNNRLPVEIETAVFDAIRHVVDDGIVVIEAAANGSFDLDTFRNAANRNILNRNSADFQDSGAIMVGAASSTVPHTRLGFSNFGSRVDCFGWGENIDTTGGSSASTTAYTTGFNGTSGASPIVAGAAVLLQSWRKQRTKSVYSPEDMRDVLTSPAQNTTSANPASDRIGVMPNLRGIIEFAERFHYEPLRYMSLVYILFGLIDDSPGAVWVPGKGPVPVDPGWGRLRRSIPAHKRDLLGALAINEIAQMMDDPGVRTRLSGAAVDAMRDAVERVARMG